MIVGALVTGNAGRLRPRELPEGLSSPVLALELVRSPGDACRILRCPAANSPQGEAVVDERPQIVKATYIDFVFIALYAGYLVLTGVLAWKTGWRVTGAITLAAALAAGVFDIAENLAILRMLAGEAVTPRVPSLWKWSAFFIAVGGLVPLLVDTKTLPLRRWIGYIGAALAAWAAAEGLIGSLRGHDLTIEASSARAALALLLSVIFFATHWTLRDGLLQALDRLAATRALGWLATWPERDPEETVGPPLVPPRPTPGPAGEVPGFRGSEVPGSGVPGSGVPGSK